MACTGSGPGIRTMGLSPTDRAARIMLETSSIVWMPCSTSMIAKSQPVCPSISIEMLFIRTNVPIAGRPARSFSLTAFFLIFASPLSVKFRMFKMYSILYYRLKKLYILRMLLASSTISMDVEKHFTYFSKPSRYI